MNADERRLLHGTVLLVVVVLLVASMRPRAAMANGERK